MKHRDLARRLRAAGFRMTQGKGDHEKWTAPNGQHVTIASTTTVSPAVVRAALRAIDRATTPEEDS